MPEPSYKDYIKKNGDHTLSRAHEIGQLVKISCQLCRVTRRYRSGDIEKVCGDVPIFHVARNFRCEQCGKKEYMSAEFELPTAAQMVGMRIRRLVTIKTVRRPVWEDITL